MGEVVHVTDRAKVHAQFAMSSPGTGWVGRPRRRASPKTISPTQLPASTDVLVVGGGVIGLTIALEFKRRHPDARLVLIEKEAQCGLHASGRNSGVLHAGFYYSADSLKARFTREGNRRLQAYCEDRRIPVRRCGKLVVARDENDLAGIDELLRRGQAAGVELQELSEAEAQAIEPAAITYQRAVFSPSTAVVDPAAVMESLAKDADRAGIAVTTRASFLGRQRDRITTSAGPITAGYVINAAGLYADVIAHQFGMAQRYTLLPFKGLYLKAKRARPALRTHVYPVPDLRYPFLGVHFTVTANGGVKVGPTAIPAFWREHYSGLRGFRAREFGEVLRLLSGLLLSNRMGFRSLARKEFPKYSKRRLVALASQLTRSPLEAKDWAWGPAGIRTQLYDHEEGRLEMDFLVDGDARSLHVLNAVSPAFTSALPFAKYIVDEVEARIQGRTNHRHDTAQARPS